MVGRPWPRFLLSGAKVVRNFRHPQARTAVAPKRPSAVRTPQLPPSVFQWYQTRHPLVPRGHHSKSVEVIATDGVFHAKSDAGDLVFCRSPECCQMSEELVRIARRREMTLELLKSARSALQLREDVLCAGSWCEKAPMQENERWLVEELRRLQ